MAHTKNPAVGKLINKYDYKSLNKALAYQLHSFILEHMCGLILGELLNVTCTTVMFIAAFSIYIKSQGP